MDTAKLNAEFPSTIGLISEGGHIWGIPTKADVKSMIWYPIKAFAAKGYAVPTTWDELVALADKIVADGGHPFCVSAGGPGTATGWELTDWVEEVLLKTEDPAGHRLTGSATRSRSPTRRSRPPSTSVGSLLFKEGYVDGGGTAIVNNDLKTESWIRCSTRTRPRRVAGCRRSPSGTARTSSRIKRINGGDSKYKIGDDGDIGIFPFPTISDTVQGRRGLG